MLDVANCGNIKAVHISKDKQTIFEYIRENEMGTSLFSVGCIFKSFLSVLVGVAIYEGKIESIEEKCKCYNILNQIYTKNMLNKEVTEAGFKSVCFFDDVQGNEYTGLANTICGMFCK